MTSGNKSGAQCRAKALWGAGCDGFSSFLQLFLSSEVSLIISERFLSPSAVCIRSQATVSLQHLTARGEEEGSPARSKSQNCSRHGQCHDSMPGEKEAKEKLSLMICRSLIKFMFTASSMLSPERCPQTGQNGATEWRRICLSDCIGASPWKCRPFQR